MYKILSIKITELNSMYKRNWIISQLISILTEELKNIKMYKISSIKIKLN